ncbi:PA14 domain protein [uncultured archaeon]|nr:PA14 domain protein [uncultured archaeon]
MNSINTQKSDCGCCEEKLPKSKLGNPPGQPMLAYRLDKHSTFLRRMLTNLPGQVIQSGPNKGTRPLTKLITLAKEDPAIALLDAWATVADVLTFYQERIANEGYLRTSTERRSVLELARSIGYELNPGVAASAFLAFTVENAQGAPGYATVNEGTKVMSIPKQDKKPQIFETVEKIEARAEWNALKPRATELKMPDIGAKEVYLKGITTGLKRGDGLLFVGKECKQDQNSKYWDFHLVRDVYPDPKAGYTKVTWDEGLVWKNTTKLSGEENIQVYVFHQRVSLFGYNAPDWNAMPDSVQKNYIIPPIGNGTGLYGEYFNIIDPNATSPTVTQIDPNVDFHYNNASDNTFPSGIGPNNFSARWKGFVQPESTGIYTFHTNSDDGVRLWVDDNLIINNWTDHAAWNDYGTIALVAGHLHDIKLEYYQRGGRAIIQLYWSYPNIPEEIIPKSHLYPRDFYQNINEWPGFAISSVATPLPNTIYLDAIYPQILQDSWLILSTPDYQELYQVVNVADDSRSNFTLSAKTTRVTLDGKNLANFDDKLRQTIVFAQSELLEIAETPCMDILMGNSIELDGFVKGLESGRKLIISGKMKRALITEIGLKLISADGIERSLNPGDVLQVLKPPVKNGAVRQWMLRDRSGFEGIVNDTKDGILLQPATKDDSFVSEIVFLSDVDDSKGRSTLIFKQPMQNCYDLVYYDPTSVPTSLVIYANVALATHGETVPGGREVLGSGDGSQANQSFVLKKPYLTYVSAPTPGGSRSTLEVRVNDVRWEEVPILYGLEAHSQDYIVRIDNDARAKVIFGDGKNGARLPSGTENVVAVYRSGIGLDGEVDARSLTILQTRPPGIREVTNPLSAAGASEPEKLDKARINAPRTVLTFDRIVSLRDFEDFTRSFPGIGKVQAVDLWTGERHLVHITVADATGKTIDPNLRSNLFNSIKTVCDDPMRPVEIADFKQLTFSLEAKILVDSRYQYEEVKKSVESALLENFNFEKRDFGQSVTSAEIMKIIQGIKGVLAVDLDKLVKNTDIINTIMQPPTILVAHTARWENGQMQLAELLLINPAGINLKKMEDKT